MTSLRGKDAVDELTSVAVVMWYEQSGRESHSPLHRREVTWTGMAEIGAEYSLHLSPRLMGDSLQAAVSTNAEYVRGHTQYVDTICER